MPTYEHICENGHTFDEFQSIVADPIEICPICGARATRKISGGTGLIFKGTGFYITDYARKGSVTGSGTHSSTKRENGTGSTPPKADSPSGEKKS